MKYGIKTVVLSLLLLSGFSQAQDMKVRMVAYKDCHPDLNSLDFVNKPQQCSMSSQTITFMVEGNNIAVIDEKSLKLSKLEVAGKDVRYNRKGDNNFELGSFPKVDDDGKYAIFDISFKSVPFGKVVSASIDGTVDIITSERLINDEKNSLDLKQGFLITSGPLTVSNQLNPKQPATGMINQAGEALAEGLKTAFMGNQDDNLVLYVKGDLDAFVELEVFEKGKKLDSKWSSWNNDKKTVTFAKPSGSVIDLKLKYWDGLERVVIPVKL